MKRTYRSLAAVLVLGAAPALAAQAPPQAPKPGPEHQKLAYFAGRWTSAGDFKPGPMGPGGKMTSTTNCEWFEGGFFVVCRYDGRMPTGPMKGLGIMGYNPERKKYTYYSIDNSGMPPEPAYATITGDTWTWEGEGTMGGQVVKGRYIIKVVSPDEYTWRWEMSMGGQPFTLVAEGSDKRVKGGA
jgi:hypothetical protein